MNKSQISLCYIIPGITNLKPIKQEIPHKNVIASIVAKAYGLTVDQLQTKTRKPPILTARQLAMLLIYVSDKNITHEIAADFFGQNHSNSLNCKKSISSTCFTYKDEKVKMLAIADKCGLIDEFKKVIN